MRQLIVRVPRGCGERVLDIAREHGGTSMARVEASDDGAGLDLVLVNTSNHQVEALLDALEAVPEVHITFFPQGVLALRPPAEEAPDQAVDVQPLSAAEIFLSGLQSVGSWKGFLGYAALAGVIVWIGLFTETVFLLVAAMLIAPFAGPAMNAALGTARGDLVLIRRALARYFAALGVAILVALLLSLVMRQRIATGLMVDVSTVSSVAVLLPLAAGAAGALNLSQSQRSSLVSGAATGMLIAASLAPPTGLVGMGIALGDWDMVKSAAFLLFLQIVGINVSGAVVFRVFGVGPEGARYPRGRGWIGQAAWAVSVAALAVLLALQYASEPSLIRSSQAQRATADARETVQESDLARLVQANARFTRAEIPGQDTLLVTVYVQIEPGGPADAIEQRLAAAIKQRLSERYDAVPLVEVTALER